MVVARSAEEGLRIAREQMPHIVLMDGGLPGMDGLEATRRSKQEQDTCEIPVVCLTAHAMEGDQEKADAAGADGYIAKPISTRKFAEQVAAYL